jgi:hypothetical protein
VGLRFERVVEETEPARDKLLGLFRVTVDKLSRIGVLFRRAGSG